MAAYDRNNIFARILRGELPCKKVYEDEFALAFHDINPLAPVHVLVIPKGEYVSNADFSATAPGRADRRLLARRRRRWRSELGLEPDGYRLVANHGPNGGQIVFHFHVHIFGGRQQHGHARCGVAGHGMIARRACWRWRTRAAGRRRRCSRRGRASMPGARKQRAVRFAGSDGATLAGTLLLPIMERAAEGAGRRAGGGQRPDRPRRQQSAGCPSASIS